MDADPAADHAIDAAGTIARVEQEFSIIDMEQAAPFEDG
jgi:hypothetical protein